MKVEKKNVRQDNACFNFCDKGELTGNGYGLRYPYQEVYQFKRDGNGLLASICAICLQELNSHVNELL